MRIDAAKTANEVLELLATAVVAAVACDERELPRTRRIRWHNAGADVAVKLLVADVKRPSRPAGGGLAERRSAPRTAARAAVPGGLPLVQ